MKNFLWFLLGLLVASGTLVAQNLTLTEQLLTSLRTDTTGGTQKTQIVDGSGSVVGTLVSGAMPVNVNNSTTALVGNVDGVTPASSAANSPVNSYGFIYNGSTYDRARSGGVTGMAGVALQATPTGGATISSAIAPATPAGVNLKNGAGTVYTVNVTTVQATPVYVKLYNSGSAPTCGSGTPVARFMVPSNATAADGAGTNISFPVGLAFGSGIGYCVTGALADNDTTAITATNTLVNISWN